MTVVHLYVKHRECLHVMVNHQYVNTTLLITFVEMDLCNIHNNVMMEISTIMMVVTSIVLLK